MQLLRRHHSLTSSRGPSLIQIYVSLVNSTVPSWAGVHRKWKAAVASSHLGSVSGDNMQLAPHHKSLKSEITEPVHTNFGILEDDK